MDLKSEIVYARKMVEAGVDGITAAWEKSGDRVVEPITTGRFWLPASIGAASGLVGVLLNRNRRSAAGFAIGGLIGSVLGFSAGMAWASREFSGEALKTAAGKVHTVLDARWLEHNPINYA